LSSVFTAITTCVLSIFSDHLLPLCALLHTQANELAGVAVQTAQDTGRAAAAKTGEVVQGAKSTAAAGAQKVRILQSIYSSSITYLVMLSIAAHKSLTALISVHLSYRHLL
jgi:hypothetical protein